jgi:hypothetical protein
MFVLILVLKTQLLVSSGFNGSAEEAMTAIQNKKKTKSGKLNNF